MSDLIQQSSGDYIPRTDAGKRNFLNTFASVVAQDPYAAGLLPEDSTILSGLAQAFDAAYEVSVSPQTRTATTIEAKDAARNQAVETFRVYAQQVKENLGVSSELKIAMGIHIDDTVPSPVPAPETYPLLAIVSAENGIHVVRYADSETPSSRAKAPGAAQIQIFRKIGDEPTTDMTDAVYVGSFGKQPIQLTYDPSDAGKTATLWGRWITLKGLEGPWGPPVAMTIAFGGAIELQSAA